MDVPDAQQAQVEDHAAEDAELSLEEQLQAQIAAG